MKYRTSASAKLMPLVLATSILTTSIVPGLGVLTAHAAAGSYVTLSSFSGHAGTITVSGGGYAAGEQIQISAVQGGATVATATGTADTNGSFSQALTIPVNVVQGNVAITAVGAKSGDTSSNGYYDVPFSAQLSTSTGSVTPFGTVGVSGTGYAPNEVVDLNFSGTVTKATADNDGSFKSVTVAVPNLPAGSYQLIGVGEGSGATSTAYEYINGFYPSAYPNNYFIMPGQLLGFSGSGFAPGETVNVTDPKTGAVLTSFKAMADGSFTNAGQIAVPFSAAGGTVSYGLVGMLSHASTTVSTGVGQYYPSASPSVYYALPGSDVSFYGSGFIAGETVNIMSGQKVLTSATADKMGDLAMAGTVTIPVSAAGTTASYTLKGLTSMGTATVSLSVGNFAPNVSPSSYYINPGSDLAFTGSGYAPGETVDVMNGKTLVTTIKVDKNGGFTSAGTVTIPYSQVGSASYTLVGESSKASVGVSVGVAALQVSLSPSSYYVLPYAPFSAGVAGFVPGETVTFSLGTNSMGAAFDVVADAKGHATIDTLMAVPTKSGSLTLMATGGTSGASVSVNIAVGNYVPSVTSSNYYTQPGTTVQVAGSSYAPGETVDITAGGTTTTATADNAGMFTAPLVVPFGSKTDSLVITATGELSLAASSTTITLAPFNLNVSPSTYWDQPGNPVSFTGSGFVAGETVTYGLNGTTLGSVVADKKGNITVPASALPFGKAADYTFIGNQSMSSFKVSVGLAQFYAGIELSSYYGNAGTPVTVSGSGFAAGEKVTLMSGKTVLATVTASATGTISQAIAVPYQAAGNAKITAVGAMSGASAATGYTVAQVYSSMQLATYAVPAGSAVTLLGSGYLPGEPVNVTTDRTNGTYTVVADKNGTINDSGFVIPAGTAAGNLKLTFSGSYSFTTNTITMYVQ